MKSVHWEPYEIPDAAKWQELTRLLEAHPAKWMIWEATPQAEVADWLRSLGVACIVFEPCGNVPEQGDYLQVMQRNIESLKAIVAGQRHFL